MRKCDVWEIKCENNIHILYILYIGLLHFREFRNMLLAARSHAV